MNGSGDWRNERVGKEGAAFGGGAFGGGRDGGGRFWGEESQGNRRGRGRGNRGHAQHERGRGGGRGRRYEAPVFYSSFEEIIDEEQPLFSDVQVTDVDAHRERAKPKGADGVLRFLPEHRVAELMNHFVLRFPYDQSKFKYYALPKAHPEEGLEEEEVHPYYQADEDLHPKKLELRRRAFNSLTRSKQQQIRKEMPLVSFFQHFEDNIRTTKYMLMSIPNGFMTFVGSKDFTERLASMTGKHEKETSLQGCVAVPLTELQIEDDHEEEALIERMKERVPDQSVFEGDEQIVIGHTLKTLLETHQPWKSQCEEQFSNDEPLYVLVLLERKFVDRFHTTDETKLKFDIPGGRRMATESTFECADRERQEEMALTPDVESSVTDIILSIMGSSRMITIKSEGNELYLLCVPEDAELSQDL